MKRKIRYNAFETNSSSAHAICISKKKKVFSLSKIMCKRYYIIPLRFSLGSFGWEFNVLKTPEKKASYLYTAIFCLYENSGHLEEVLYDLGKILKKYNFKFTFTVSKEQLKNLKPFFDSCNISCCAAKTDGSLWYFTDHVWELGSFVSDILKNEYELLTLLFGDSFIVTGNDNDEKFEDYMCKSEYDGFRYNLKELPDWKDKFKDYDIYYKGN